MKIQVTLEFNSPEEAIVALGKYVKDAPAPVAKERTDKAATLAPAAAGTPKRGRGRPPKNKGADAPAQEATPPEGNAPQPAHEPSGGERPSVTASRQDAEPTASPPTEQDVIAALQACLNAVGMTKTRACFKRFGVERGAELKPEQRQEFIEFVGKVAKKEIDPEAGA